MGSARYEMLVQAITDYAIYMLDLDGIVLSWNAGAERLKGYAETEIVEQRFQNFFTPEERATGRPEAALKTAAETGRWEDEGWRVRKDGSRFWALAVLDAIRDTDGKLVGFAKITRDMTERRIAQQALAESERRFRLLVSSVIDYALFTLDLEGIVQSWNPGAERVKGYTAAEIIGKQFSIFYPRKHARLVNRGGYCQLCGARDGLTVRAGASGRTEPGFGPMSSSTRSTTMMAI